MSRANGMMRSMSFEPTRGRSFKPSRRNIGLMYVKACLKILDFEDPTSLHCFLKWHVW
jgi:hypothetical protein